MISPVESLEFKCVAKENRDCSETKFTSFLRDQSFSPQKQTHKQKIMCTKYLWVNLSKEATLNFVSNSRILSSDAAALTMLPAQKLLTRTVFMTDVIRPQSDE